MDDMSLKVRNLIMDDSPKSKGKRMLPWFIEWEKRAMNVRAEG